MDEEIVKKYASHVERTGWILVFWGMLTQVSTFGFPSYNIVLGFWGAYCSFSKHGRATFGYICFLFLSIFLDIIFCSIYGSQGQGPTFNFALTMLIFGLFTKLAALYSSSHFFSSIGGAYSMESSLGQSAYDALASNSNSAYRADPAQYSPPTQHRKRSNNSRPSVVNSTQGLRRGLQSSDEEADDDQDEIGPRETNPRPGVF